MKRVVPTNKELLEEMKEKTGCSNSETASSKTCNEAAQLYKQRGGKYKRIKTKKDIFLV